MSPRLDRRPPQPKVAHGFATATALAMACALAGCTGNEASPVSATTAPIVLEAATTTAAGSPPPPSDDEPTIAPPTATAPATAGGLTSDVFPSMTGWTPVPGTGDEGRYIPNGTWVHAVEPTSQAFELMLQRCTTPPTAYPQPTAALAATWENGAGNPATALALEFASDASAQRFLTLYAEGVLSCGLHETQALFAASRIDIPGADLVTRRHFLEGSGDWVEVVHRNGSTLRLTIVSDGPRMDAAAITELVHMTAAK